MKDRKRIALVYFVCICIIAIMASCESNLDIAFKAASKNRQKLDKVLNHLKAVFNHLKYKIAKFLIEDMPLKTMTYLMLIVGHPYSVYNNIIRYTKSFGNCIFPMGAIRYRK